MSASPKFWHRARFLASMTGGESGGQRGLAENRSSGVVKRGDLAVPPLELFLMSQLNESSLAPVLTRPQDPISLSLVVTGTLKPVIGIVCQ